MPPQRRPRRQQQARRPPAQHRREPAQQGRHHPLVPREGSDEGSSTGSSTSISSSGSNGSSGSSSNGSSSRSGSTSSSDRSGSQSDGNGAHDAQGSADNPPAVAAPAPGTPEQPTEPPPKRKRFMTGSTLFGDCRITPTLQDGIHSGWQMTCAHPQHNLAGAARCTKTRSGNYGGLDTALRMLKWWQVLGCDVASKKEHAKLWQQVANTPEGDIPSMEELDAMAPIGLAGGSASASSRARPAPGGAASSSGA